MKITQNNVEVSVLCNGTPVKLFAHDGKTFVEAKLGAEYSIKIKNNNSQRIEAVVSVDGVDVISGKPALHSRRGYVINAYSTYEVKGYRKDQETVGSFKFTKKKKAYAKQATGTNANVGVIAVACFYEKLNYTWISYPITDSTYDWYEKPRGGTANPIRIWYSSTMDMDSSKTYAETETFMNCSNVKIQARSNGEGQSCKSLRFAAPQFEAGTTWGTKVQDKVTTTSFERASETPFAEPTIYYDTRRNLEAIGIQFVNEPAIATPHAFPNAFANPPAGWVS